MNYSYYSNVLNKPFDSVEELEEAEKIYEEKTSAVTNERKALAKKVEEAEAKVTEAYAEYQKAEEDVKDIFKEARLQSEERLAPAKAALKAAKEERCAAYKEFESKYGGYLVRYTGQKAIDEYNKVLNSAMEDVFNIFNYIFK